MNSYNTYVLFLCAIVFVLFTATFSITITIIAKQKLKLIRCGQEDQAIKTEYEKSKKKSKVFNVISTVISTVFFVVLLTAFLFSIYLQTTEDKRPNGVPSLKVVLSGSMSFKNEKNEYLFKNELNNQIQTFDLVVVNHLPPENQLKLYDIVVYQLEDGDYVIHRIVKIEEPNEKHPDCRWFLLQGDAVSNADVYPVLYSQMQGIYMGQRIPFVGSFITFMQSPAGWFCILLVIITFIAMPILEKKIEKAKKLRLAILYPETEPETEMVLTEDKKVSVFKEIRAKVNDKTFTDKLEENPIAKDRYIDISALLNRVDGVRVIESKKARTYKCGNTALAKFDVKGKTLNAYIGLEPEEYQYTKYIFTDESSIKKHANYPMRVKVSSDRQQRWVKELLIEKINKEGLTLLEEPKIVENTWIFASLKNKKASKSFKQKLKLSPVAKERFNDIKKELESIPKIRIIEGKNNITYKVKSLAVVRFAIKGKTLNAYLNLNPSEYKDTKYIFIDVSSVKKYANYPMRVKVSSDRQVKWVKELISQVLTKGDK